MALTRYSANFNLREDLIDQITPKAKMDGDNNRSVGDFRPANWLPIQFTKSNRDAGSDAFVISSFKPVSLDTSVTPNGFQGTLVPSGMRLQLGGSGSSGVFAGTALTYTALDVTWGVIDLVTGEKVAAAVTYTGEQVADALIERGLVRDDEAITAGATVPAAADADLAIIVDLFISPPVGIVLQDVNVWSGLPEEGNQHFTNYSKQHAIAFETRGTYRVPLRAAGEETSDSFDAATLDGGGSTTYVAGAFIDDGEYWTAAEFTDINRYSAYAATVPVIALGLAERWVAKNTDRTPFTSDVEGVLVRERSGIDLITREGDWYLDADVGVLFLHEDTWATLVAGSTTVSFSYSFYTDTGLASAHRFIHFDGPCRPGCAVYYDAQSNFVMATAAQVAAAAAIGRVHKFVYEPRSLLDKVKTAWNLSGASATMKMPGSATKGYSDLITLSQETVADTLVQITIDIR